MKKSTIIFLLSLFTFYCSASEPLKIGVISDTHFLSGRLMDGGYTTEDYVYTTARDIINLPAILDSVLADFMEAGIQVLLISGDITKDGEKLSHIDFVKRLKPLQDKGINIFVIPGNHDIETGKEIRFVGNKAFSTEGTTADDFREIYKDCGYNAAFDKDTASLSYVAEIDENTWLIAIDVARGTEYKKMGLPSEAISARTEQWIIDILNKAASQKVSVIGMMHWGLAEHFSGQAKYFPRYLVYDWERLATLFADNGMKVIFTGHFHANDITGFSTKKDNTIYDIETGALCSFPFVYRIANLYPDRIDVASHNILSLPGKSSLGDDNKILLKQLATNIAVNRLKDSGLDFDPSFISGFAEVIAQIFLLHVRGDEKISDELQILINSLAKNMGIDGEDPRLGDLDFPPADNNVTLKF